jgi:NhaA family Na+:H+ antiporter
MARSPTQIMRDFIDSEASGGLVLMASAALALVVANSPLAAAYFDLLEHHVFGLSILHWVNDVLMALFFVLVGRRSNASCWSASSQAGETGRCPGWQRSAA